MKLTLVKLALRRDNSFPVGVPAPMHLMCPCGLKVNVPFNPEAKTFRVEVIACECGREYDSFGYVVNEAYKAEKQALANELAAHWCKCEKEGEAIFCNDGERINQHCCNKHHYHCSNCKKITQVG